MLFVSIFYRQAVQRINISPGTGLYNIGRNSATPHFLFLPRQVYRYLTQRLTTRSDCTDRVILQLPYNEYLGIDRVGGGAISALVDIAASCAFWSNDSVSIDSRGATIGFSINFLRLVTAEDIWATSTVRRRGGSICVADVSVSNGNLEEVAIAVVTYKLST